MTVFRHCRISVSYCQEHAASDLVRVNETIDHGYRLISHPVVGNKLWTKPCRWISYRRVAKSTIMESTKIGGNGVGQNDDHNPYVWHVVVHKLDRNQTGRRPIVCTTYFMSPPSIFYDAIHEKLQFLADEDDPRIIEPALQDEYFCELLKRFFEHGDTRNKIYFKTLATVPVMCESDGSVCTLLEFCCFRGRYECVKLLLRKYSTRTAKENWLQLADPLLQNNFGFCAFHIAALCGNARLFRLLWEWARDCHEVGAVKNIRARNGKSVIDIVEQGLDKISEPSQLIYDYLEIFNLLAKTFSRQQKPLFLGPFKQVVCRPKSCFVIDVRDKRTVCRVPPSVSLDDLASILETVLATSLNDAIVEFHNVHVVDTLSNVDESSLRFVQSLSMCEEIAFVNCSSVAQVPIHLIRYAAQLLRSGNARWKTLDLVLNWTDIGPEGDPLFDEFATAVEFFLSATTDGFITNNFSDFVLSTASVKYFPPSRSHLYKVVTTAFMMKRVLQVFVSDEQWRVCDPKVLSTDFTPYNPMLRLCAVIDRYFVSKDSLAMGKYDVLTLDTSWKPFVRCMVDLWLSQLPMLRDWSTTMLPDAAQYVDLMHRLVDEAIVYLMKMQPTKRRPGIEIVPEVLEGLSRHAWRDALPKTEKYLRQRNLESKCKGSVRRAQKEVVT
eukprot:GEMP01009309.1.p1 GENE.GEMP01009309.1~~GEMP01009309.1.p1  ORF type:complete len:709 (+),score=92.09 GEMP01009309.1:134-2128(+)